MTNKQDLIKTIEISIEKLNKIKDIAGTEVQLPVEAIYMVVDTTIFSLTQTLNYLKQDNKNDLLNIYTKMFLNKMSENTDLQSQINYLEYVCDNIMKSPVLIAIIYSLKELQANKKKINEILNENNLIKNNIKPKNDGSKCVCEYYPAQCEWCHTQLMEDSC